MTKKMDKHSITIELKNRVKFSASLFASAFLMFSVSGCSGYTATQFAGDVLYVSGGWLLEPLWEPFTERSDNASSSGYVSGPITTSGNSGSSTWQQWQDFNSSFGSSAPEDQCCGQEWHEKHVEPYQIDMSTNRNVFCHSGGTVCF